MLCEMCNRKEACCRAVVEGAELSLCRDCGRFGRITAEIKIQLPAKKAKQAISEALRPALNREKEVIEVIAGDFSIKIRKAREKMGLTQDEFARKISEKESIVHKLETGIMEPDIGLAKKLEKVLHIKLIEQKEEDSGAVAAGKEKETGEGQGFTLGDFVRKN